MKRKLMDKLVEWKNSDLRKPLIINGARQVGKTWIMKEFGDKHYSNVAYINFENNNKMNSLFDGDFNTSRIIEGLQLEVKDIISPDKTLIVFDEVQEAPKALTSLKYFYENAPQYSIIAAGSLLGVAMHQGTSFPVGKIDYCNLFPLCFFEFLEAIDETGLVELLLNKDWELISCFQDKLIDLLRKYYFIGGMPEAVAHYSQNKDFTQVRNIQEQILFAYDRDFSKHAPSNIVPQIRTIWDSVPTQLARENKKFSPGIIRKGSRLSDYETSL
ncbi:MAG: AAA family ATPase, partial [Oscillospiraceae bacterium]|nr:AAA family ATPase [Oscillospiraceae bacterium]